MAQSTGQQDEFVDLYALLDVPQDADTGRLRKTISELYLEAQKNLDHRNARKRLQYQQMYEVYLPQARHLLLDDARRAEYDRYLKAFLSGQTYTPAPKAEPAPQKPAELPETHAAPPEKPAELTEEEQAALWSKWKSGLQVEEEIEPIEVAPAEASTPAPQTAPQPQSTPAPQAPSSQSATRPAPQPPTRPAPQPAAKPAPRSAGARPAPRVAGAPDEEEQEEKRQREAAEFQRQQQRMQMIRSTVQTVGLMWRLVVGVGVFALGCLLVFALDGYFGAQKQYPLNMSRGLFDGIGILLIVALAAWASQTASRHMRRQKNMELSLLSYEELRRKIG